MGMSAATFRSATRRHPRFVPRWTRVTEKWDARQRIPTGKRISHGDTDLRHTAHTRYGAAS